MSFQDIINFFKEYGDLLSKYPAPFITCGALCITVTSAIWGWVHKKAQAKLQEKIKQMEEDSESHRQEIDSLEKKNLSLNEELKRVKKQFENLTLEGYIVASREKPEGIAAEKISKRFQNGKDV